MYYTANPNHHHLVKKKNMQVDTIQKAVRNTKKTQHNPTFAGEFRQVTCRGKQFSFVFLFIIFFLFRKLVRVDSKKCRSIQL